MKIFRSFEDAKEIRNPVVTTGSFDGVHIGHKAILNRLQLLAEKHHGESVLITFYPHPRKVLYPETSGKDLKLINSQEEKLALLEKAGLSNVIIIEFTEEFSKVTSEKFVRDILHGVLNARIVVVGFNHNFGFNKEGNFKNLWAWQEKYDFQAEEIPEMDVQSEKVSSTIIRKAISEGYIQRANAYLDHYYIIMGECETCFHETSSVPLPLIKISVTEESKLLPSDGIYAVSVESGPTSSKGMVIIHGKSEDKPEVLLDLIDDASLPSGNKLTVSFHKKIYGAVNLSDNKHIGKILRAREEISDLIY